VRRTAAALAALALALAPAGPAVAADGVSEVCRFSDARFTEISGLTYSQRHENVLYLHNDSSGGPLIFAVDARTCRTIATLTVSGIQARDLEAIASGRDARGRPVLWLGDIGDNRDSWPEVRLHRIREPDVLRDRTVRARTYRFTYADRPHNAEALLADPGSSRVWVVTRQFARGRLYALPQRMSRSAVNIATPLSREDGLVTDGAVSPDGSRYALRDYVDAVTFDGLPPGAQDGTVYLPLQLQGEAMTWTADGSALLVAGERDDRLLRVEVPASEAGRPPTPAATLTGAAAAPSTAPGAVAAPRDTDPGTGPPAALPAVGLVALAGAVIATAEWRRRRPRAGRPAGRAP